MFREDNIEQIRERRKAYDEANKERIKRGKRLTENPTKIKEKKNIRLIMKLIKKI